MVNSYSPARANVPCFAVTILALIAHPYVADASVLRGNTAELTASNGASPEFEKTLLAEIEEVLGSEHRRATERRLARIEEALRPTFRALPKNGQGRLGHAAVRYAMHRLFVQRHAWYVQGLDPKGEAWNETSPTVILEDGLPAYIQTLFEQRMGGSGFDLHDVAVMAATLENLVHKESMQRLAGIYRVMERSSHDPVTKEESYDLIDTYMASFILGVNMSRKTPSQVERLLKILPEYHLGWPQTQKFMREVQATVAPSQRDELTYENVATVVEEIGERYGRWQDHECRTMKNDLVALEDAGTGRVRIADFYHASLHDGKWQFKESIAFLREHGALDESDPSNPSVIIPNYINSPSNCLASSNYYSVCCIDECEDVFDHIEEKIGAPTATPAEISSLVAALPSSTVAADRTLSPLLLRRLEEVAAHHGGQIPLHGRLFAQWLHFAYPRECPYPHMQGTTVPTLGADNRTASTEEMEAHLKLYANSGRPSTNALASDSQSMEEQHPMWTMEEELIVTHEPAQNQPSSKRGYVRTIMGVAVLCSIGVTLWQTIGVTLLQTFTATKKHGGLLPTHHAKYM